MPVRNQNWYDLQEGRRYPLDDRGTGVSDSGTLLRDNIIVDCHLKFPSSYGLYPYISGITVTGGLVTAVVSVAANLDGDNSRVLCAVTVPKPITIFQNYAMTPIAPGVAGWIAFGSGCAENFTEKYSKPTQTLINVRNARPYSIMPVTSIGKSSLQNTLKDIVKIRAENPIVAEYASVTVNNKPANAIIFSLRGQFTDTEQPPLKEFLGPCGARPESGTCAKKPILTINGIKPDCYGNIDISVGNNLTAYMFDTCGGMGIGFPLGLGAFCPKEEVNPDCTRIGGPPIEGSDLCETQIASSSSSAPPPVQSSTSASPPITTSSSSAAGTACLTLPYAKNLKSTEDTAIVIRSGVFTQNNIVAPEIQDSVTQSSSSSSSSNSSGKRSVLQATAVTGFNILTIKNCATDWAINRRISATFKIGGGSARNAGVIVNYLTPQQTGNYTTFLAAILDLSEGKFKLIRYNGTSVVTELSTTFADLNFVYDATVWYTLSVTPSLYNNNVLLFCEISKFGEPVLASFSVQTSNYGFVAGAAGVISNQSYTYFSHITIGV